MYLVVWFPCWTNHSFLCVIINHDAGVGLGFLPFILIKGHLQYCIVEPFIRKVMGLVILMTKKYVYVDAAIA